MLSKNRVFLWMLNVPEFTALQIAQHSDVSIDSVRTVIARLPEGSLEIVEAPEEGEVRRRGGQTRRYRLTGSGQAHIVRSLHRVQESVSIRGEEDPRFARSAALGEGNAEEVESEIPEALTIAVDVARHALREGFPNAASEDERRGALHSATEALKAARIHVGQLPRVEAFRGMGAAPTHSVRTIERDLELLERELRASRATSSLSVVSVTHEANREVPTSPAEDRWQEWLDGFRERIEEWANAPGQLQRVLAMTAAEIARRTSVMIPPLVAVSPRDRVAVAVQQMVKYELHELPVISLHEPIGGVNYGLLGMTMKDRSLLDLKIESVMEPRPWQVINASLPMPEVVEALSGKESHALLRHDHEIVGLLSRQDVCNVIGEAFLAANGRTRDGSAKYRKASLY